MTPHDGISDQFFSVFLVADNWFKIQCHLPSSVLKIHKFEIYLQIYLISINWLIVLLLNIYITYLWIAPMQYKATGIWSCPVWLAPRQVPRAFNNTVRSNRLNDCTLFFFLCSYLRTHSFSCWPLRYSIWIFLSQVMLWAKNWWKNKLENYQLCKFTISNFSNHLIQNLLLFIWFKSL